MIPETVVAMLACARIGAPHTVVFGGFSAEALRGPDPRLRRAASSSPPTAATAAARRPRSSRRSTRRWPTARTCATCWSSAAPARTSTGPRAATSGGTTSSTGSRPSTTPRRSTPSTRSTSCTPRAPRASRRASCTPPAATSPRSPYTHWAVFDLKAETDVYWCAADIGWVTGHSYIVYGPLANGATSVMYEGTPDTPHQGRWWEIIEKYRVTILYTAPDRDPHVHEVGRRASRRARPVLAAAARLGRRADQPRGLDLVPHEHRRRPHARSSTPGGRPRPAPS